MIIQKKKNGKHQFSEDLKVCEFLRFAFVDG